MLMVLTAFWLLIKSELRNTLQQQSDSLGNTLVVQTADSVTELVLANDQLSLNVVLSQLARNENILNVAVFDVDNQLLASSGATSTTPGIINATYTAQISLQDSFAGTVHLNLDISEIQQNDQQNLQYFWFILGLGIVLTVTVAYALGSHFADPILRLIAAIQNPEDSKYETDPKRSDEIALLEHVCVDLIGHADSESGSQIITADFRSQAQSGQFSHQQSLKLKASVLVVTVVNMNTAIELLHPSTLSNLLNEYYFYIQQASKLYGGVSHQSTGDSVLIIFDSRYSSDDHSFNAVCCAQLFLKLMKKINRQHQAERSQSLEFRLGIHSGDIFISVSTAVEKYTETAIGKTLEISRLLCKMSEPGELIISETTFSHAGGNERLDSKSSTEITLPTDNMSFMAYILKDAMNAYLNLLEKQTKHILSGQADNERTEATVANSQNRRS